MHVGVPERCPVTSQVRKRNRPTRASGNNVLQPNWTPSLSSYIASLQVKLVSIDAAEIADGNPSLVLGLIWNIILFFQVKSLLSHNIISVISTNTGMGPGSRKTVRFHF